ncbi:hypothetical protein [Vibrio furnissii]|uniref:hypothetical protein n=1 Tax=Vibrio furnissii TaxID=29494 RepID=UPI0003092780|nr:hypothetical protein [Vibrio furnissii]QTG88233.1 hypothetical protein JTI73_11840 [Vibrio furnissii]
MNVSFCGEILVGLNKKVGENHKLGIHFSGDANYVFDWLSKNCFGAVVAQQGLT